MRVTTHNGRSGKNGVYCTKHNDRNFNIENAPHINPEKISENFYWHCYQENCPDMTFDEAEKKFYEENFKQALDAQNDRYKKSGHKERMKTIEDYRKSKLTCPEETILQIGKMGDTVDKDLLIKICDDYLEWEYKTFPNVQILNMAVHTEEQGAPHIHVRKVWVANSKDGLIVGQNKALEEMGIKLPNPNKKRDRYNNPKVTYTKMCREHMIETCKKYGLDIQETPETTSKKTLELIEYKRQQEELKLQELQEQLEQENKQLKDIIDLKIKASQIKNRPFISWNREKETYDKEMLQEIKGIADEVYNNVKSVQNISKGFKEEREDIDRKERQLQSKEMQLQNREIRLENREKSIAERERNVNKYIEDKVRELFYKEMIPPRTPLSDRMTRFMKEIKFTDGKNAYEKFMIREKIEMDRQYKDWKSTSYTSRTLNKTKNKSKQNEMEF